jgi:hypothetical protein
VDSNGASADISIPEGHPINSIFQMVKRNSLDTLFSDDRIRRMRAIGSIELFREFGKGQLSDFNYQDTILKEENGIILYQFNNEFYQGLAVDSYTEDNFGLNFQTRRVKKK